MKHTIADWKAVLMPLWDDEIAAETTTNAGLDFRLLFESAPGASLVLTPDFTIAAAGDAYLRVTGTNREQLVGRNILDVIRVHLNDRRAPADRCLQDSLENVLRSSTPDQLAVRQYGPRRSAESKEDSPEHGWILLNTPIFNAQREVAYILHTITELPVQDTSVVRNADESLQLLSSAIQSVTQGIIVTDARAPDDPIIYVSPGFEQVTGYTASEAVGRNCRFLQGKDTDPSAVKLLRDAIRARTHCTVELLNYRKDGSSFWHSLSLTPVRDRQGHVSHFVGVQSDVTERRKLLETLHQSRKMDALGRLAGGIAHDFNNLLMIIMGACEFLQKDSTLNDDNRELATEIQKAGIRAAALTRQLLAFSRRQILQPQRLDLNTIVREMGPLLERLLGEEVVMSIHLAPSAGAVQVDRGQFEQVILNLAANARDAMPTGGTLTLTTTEAELTEADIRTQPNLKAGFYAVLAVSDTGCGMDDALTARIFDPFYTTKQAGKGTGLGLATAFGITRQSGGNMTVNSELGRGTTFKIYLPKCEQPLEVEAEDQPQLSSLRGSETILIVEDDDVLRTFTSRILTSFGYQVIAADGGAGALQAYDQMPHRIALVLTDIVMPEMSGRMLVEELRARADDLKVIFMSGYTDDAALRSGVVEAETSFLQKPFKPIVLATKVRQLLDRKDGAG